MVYNVVTNQSIISEIKKCKYFKTNLGLVNTVEKSGERVYNERDKFGYFYNTTYKTTIYGKGNIGDIMFYVDHYIKDNVLAFYYNLEEFIFEYDKDMVKEKGIEFYMGHLIKKMETEHAERIKEAESKKMEIKKDPDPDMLFKNPGKVNFSDIEAYLKNKEKSRYSVQESTDKKE